MGRYVATWPSDDGPLAFGFADIEGLASWLAVILRRGIVRPVSIYRRGRGGWVRMDWD